MNTRPRPTDVSTWREVHKDAKPDETYDDFVQRKIAQGIADADAGRVTSLEDVRKEFGLE